MADLDLPLPSPSPTHDSESRPLSPYGERDPRQLQFNLYSSAADQAKDIANGNVNARNWQDEAQKLLEKMVGICHQLVSFTSY